MVNEMSYLEILKGAKLEARSRNWWNTIMGLFHIALGGVMGWYLTMSVLQGNLFWAWAIALFFGILAVEQFIMRHIEYFLFIKLRVG